MRILFLADAVNEDLAGGSRVVARQLGHGLAARGYDVTFLVARQPTGPPAPADEVQGGVRIVRYEGAGRLGSFIAAGRAAADALQRERPFDIVHTHFAYAGVGPLLALQKGTPRIRTFHGPWDQEGWLEDVSAAGRSARRMAAARLKRRIRYFVERDNLRRSAAVVTLSEYFRSDVVERFGIERAKTLVMVGGVDSRRFTPEIVPGESRAALHLPQDRTIILTIRRLAARMGIENLIDAMLTVLAERPEALLLIGGSGPERERIEARIASLGLQGRVRLLGFIPDEQLAAYYRSADLFALPTLALEGFGLVTVEALASGVPVVGTPVGATPEILRAAPDCVVCAGASPADLAGGILTALRRRVEYEDEREAGGDRDTGSVAGQELPLRERLHRYAARSYSWEAHVESTERLYEAVIAGGQPAGALRSART